MKSVLDGVTLSDGSLLEIACGLESLARRFDAILEDHTRAELGHANDADSEIVDLVLGVIAIRERLRAVFAAAANGATDGPLETCTRVDGSWLR